MLKNYKPTASIGRLKILKIIYLDTLLWNKNEQNSKIFNSPFDLRRSSTTNLNYSKNFRLINPKSYHKVTIKLF